MIDKLWWILVIVVGFGIYNKLKLGALSYKEE